MGTTDQPTFTAVLASLQSVVETLSQWPWIAGAGVVIVIFATRSRREKLRARAWQQKITIHSEEKQK